MAPPTAKEDGAASDSAAAAATAVPPSASPENGDESSSSSDGKAAGAATKKRAPAAETSRDSSSKRARADGDGWMGDVNNMVGIDLGGDDDVEAVEAYQKRCGDVRESFRRAMGDNYVDPSVVEEVLESFFCKSIISKCAVNINPSSESARTSKEVGPGASPDGNGTQPPPVDYMSLVGLVNRLVKSNNELEGRVKQLEQKMASSANLNTPGASNQHDLTPNHDAAGKGKSEPDQPSTMEDEPVSNASSVPIWPDVRAQLEEAADLASKFALWHLNRAASSYSDWKARKKLEKGDVRFFSGHKIFSRNVMMLANEVVPERPSGADRELLRKWERSVRRIGHRGVAAASTLMGGSPSYTKIKEFKFEAGSEMSKLAASIREQLESTSEGSTMFGGQGVANRSLLTEDVKDFVAGASYLHDSQVPEWPSVRAQIEEAHGLVTKFVLWHSNQAGVSYNRWKKQQSELPRGDMRFHSNHRVFSRNLIMLANEDVVPSRPCGASDESLQKWLLSVRKIGEKGVANAKKLIDGSLSFTKIQEWNAGKKGSEVMC